MLPVALWWLIFFFFSLVGLPLTFYLFPQLPDRGYAFGKALTLLFLTYLLWLLALGHILPNTRFTIIIILLSLALFSFFLFWRRRQDIAAFLSREWPIIAVTEAIFIAAFFLWALIRSYTPDLVYGEKLMDFAFLNSSWRSPYFPPHDPWLSGYTISYYHFGYIMMAAAAKLSGVPLSISYNIAIALLFALVAIGVFSLVTNLVRLREPKKTDKAVGFGLIGIGLFLLLGNLEGFLELLHSHNFGSPEFWQWFGIKDLGAPYWSERWYPTDHWWWWRATRLIDTLRDGQSLDYTIIEFPSFSFIFGDLHPHLMSLPYTLLALALSLETFLSRETASLAWLWRNPLRSLAILISLGALGFLNSWDFPTYGAIFLAVLFLKTYYSHGRWKEWALVALFIVVGSLILYLPFYFGLNTQAKGIWPWLGPDTHPLHYFLMWGLLLFAGLSFLVAKATRQWAKSDVWAGLAAALVVFYPLVLWLLVRLSLAIFVPSLEGLPSAWDKFWHLLPLLAILILALTLLLRRRAREDWQQGGGVSLFPVLLLFTGLFTTMAVEIFYLMDMFGTRMNTVFKFYYQAWTLMAIASAFGLYYLLDRWQYGAAWNQVLRGLWWSLLLILLIMAAAYPLAATFTFTNGFHKSPTLDGLAYLEWENPGERDALRFLSQQAGNPVIVEAAGGEVNVYGRISARTGLPAVLGSASHEIQWRGSYRPLGTREADVRTIYESQDRAEVRALLEKYQVSFVYAGPLEKMTYGPEAGNQLQSFLAIAYKNDYVTIYRVPKN